MACNVPYFVQGYFFSRRVTDPGLKQRFGSILWLVEEVGKRQGWVESGRNRVGNEEDVIYGNGTIYILPLSGLNLPFQIHLDLCQLYSWPRFKQTYWAVRACPQDREEEEEAAILAHR